MSQPWIPKKGQKFFDPDNNMTLVFDEATFGGQYPPYLHFEAFDEEGNEYDTELAWWEFEDEIETGGLLPI